MDGTRTEARRNGKPAGLIPGVGLPADLVIGAVLIIGLAFAGIGAAMSAHWILAFFAWALGAAIIAVTFTAAVRHDRTHKTRRH